MKQRRTRAVDRAMAKPRPAKVTLRSLWVDRVKAVADNPPPTPEPWYLTLSGAQGLDIQSLVDARLLAVTEVESISTEDEDKVVAIENSPQALLELKKRFPGLRIKQADFRSLIRGDGPFKWPQGQDERFCRARVVNLDINAPLLGRAIDGEVSFPILEWIRKLCQIHARQPRTNWTLCLTLHGDIVWDPPVMSWMKTFMIENMEREPAFATNCQQFLGAELLNQLTSQSADVGDLKPVEKQSLIMVLVPKMIARLVHNEGWRVVTDHNLRYGGVSTAPMVSWIVSFSWDASASATPDATYREALRCIFSNIGLIAEDGYIVNG